MTVSKTPKRRAWRFFRGIPGRREAISKWFNTNGITTNGADRPDARVKLAATQRVEAVQRVESGETQAAVAADLGAEALRHVHQLEADALWLVAHGYGVKDTVRALWLFGAVLPAEVHAADQRVKDAAATWQREAEGVTAADTRCS